MNHAAIVLSVQTNSGTYLHQGTLCDSYEKCASMFSLVNRDDSPNGTYCFRVDLVDDHECVISSKLLRNIDNIELIDMV